MDPNRILNIISNRKTLIIFLFLMSVIFSFLSVRNHEQFQTFAWDLGFFDQIIWKASRFIYPYSTIGKINLLGDHFQPVLFLLAPLYWLWSNVKIILIAQSFLVIFAAYPLFLLSQEKLKNPFTSWSIILCFILFSGTQFTITNEFHQSAFIPLFLSLFLLFYERNNQFRMILSLIGLLGTREEMGFLMAALGIMMIFQKRFKQGLIIFFSGILASFFLIYLLIPILSSQHSYIHFNYGLVGEEPLDVLKFIILKPVTFLKLIFFPSIKIKTALTSFASFGFLPLLSPTSLVPILQQFIIRFIDTNTFHRWTNYNHYAAPLGPLLSYASIKGLETINKKYKKKLIIFFTVWLLVAALFFNWFNHGPLNSIFKRQLYEEQNWMKDAKKVISYVPTGIAVAAQNSLVPHLSQRNKIYLLPEINDAEYLVVDLVDGPNKYSPLNYQKTVILIRELINAEKFRVIYQEGESLLLKKND